MDAQELCRQIEMTMADLGYEPPRYGDDFAVAAFKMLYALRDMQRRLNP